MSDQRVRSIQRISRGGMVSLVQREMSLKAPLISTLYGPEGRGLDDHSEDDRDHADRAAPDGGADPGVLRRARGGVLGVCAVGIRDSENSKSSHLWLID